MNVTENVLCALIGVWGTLLGAIAGLLIPYLCKNFGRKRLGISNVKEWFRKGEADGVGSSDDLGIKFSVDVLNRKEKALNIEIIACVLYSGSNKVAVCPCYDEDSKKSIFPESRNFPNIYEYDELRYIDVAPKSSVIKKIHGSFSGDLTSCDKVVLRYSWGIVHRKKTVWDKKDMLHAKT